jgi:hypothetical protein
MNEKDGGTFRKKILVDEGIRTVEWMLFDFMGHFMSNGRSWSEKEKDFVSSQILLFTRYLGSGSKVAKSGHGPFGQVHGQLFDPGTPAKTIYADRRHCCALGLPVRRTPPSDRSYRM